MKRAWKIIKKCLKWSFYFLIVTTGLIVIFINSSPEFGGDPSKEDQARYSKTGHYENGEFKNIHVTKMDYTLEQILEVTSDYFSDDIQNIPKRPLKDGTIVPLSRPPTNPIHSMIPENCCPSFSIVSHCHPS